MNAAARASGRTIVAPTGRTAVAIALSALLVLLLPVWLGAGLIVVISAAAAADAWVVRTPPVLDRELPSTLSRGVPAPFNARSRAQDGRVILLRQRPLPSVVVERGEGRGTLGGSLTASRRGRLQLPGLSSASIGPLRLARVHHAAGRQAELRIYPDLHAARALVLRLRRSLAGLAGGAARGPLGLGTEFESVRDYSPDDDIRQLNWRATARLGRPMSNQFRIERDRDVISVIDCGRLTAAPLGTSTVLDAALDVMAVIALAADELGDRFGALVFDDRVRRLLEPRHRGGTGAIEALFDLEPRPVDSDFERALAQIARARRGLVFVHTDLIDVAAARSLLAGVKVLARRHAVIVAGATDPELARLAAGADVARAAVALDVLAARRDAVVGLRRAGASVLEAVPARLAERCLDAYVRAKLRGRL